MSELSFRLRSRFLDDFPMYVDFTIALSTTPRTYRYGTFLRRDFVLADNGVAERERDEAICEILGYGYPTSEEPLPQAYRAAKSRAKACLDAWLAFRLENYL